MKQNIVAIIIIAGIMLGAIFLLGRITGGEESILEIYPTPHMQTQLDQLLLADTSLALQSSHSVVIISSNPVYPRYAVS